MLEDLAEAAAADTELRNELGALKRDNERLALHLAQANTRVIELERSSEIAEARIADLTKLVDTVRRDAARVDEELTRLRWQNGELSQRLVRAEAARKSALTEAERARAEMAKELEAAKNAAAQSAADVGGLYKELKAKQQELADANRREEEIDGVNARPHGAPRAHADPAPEPQAKPALVEPPRGTGPEPVSRPDHEHYNVRSGETLSGIVPSHEIGVSALAQGTGIGKPSWAYAGRKLRTPSGEAAATATVALGQDLASVRLASPRARPPLRGDEFLWPVKGKVIGAFGSIDQGRRRDGIDIAARRGAPVLAAEDGIVAYADDAIPSYGQMILLRHDQGYVTTYAHCATLLVEEGDVVERGQRIARVGDTGEAAQSMLHFELRKGSTPIDPQFHLVHGTANLASSAAQWGSIE